MAPPLVVSSKHSKRIRKPICLTLRLNIDGISISLLDTAGVVIGAVSGVRRNGDGNDGDGNGPNGGRGNGRTGNSGNDGNRGPDRNRGAGGPGLRG